LNHTTTGLSHYQAVQQLSKLYHCESTLEAIKQHRIDVGFDEITRKCFDASGIECILMDDLFRAYGKVAHPSDWHDQYTASKTKRIVRIESVAEEVAVSLKEGDYMTFQDKYVQKLKSAATDPEVVGLKSVVCYRTGLDIGPRNEKEMRKEFKGWYEKCMHEGSLRINYKPINDWIVEIAIIIAGEVGIPIQFHTGLGDQDLRLLKANPAHMQNLIERFPETKFVLLHSAYPYTREAGYLASVYENVFLDCMASSRLTDV